MDGIITICKIFQVDTKVEYSDVADSFPYSSPSLEEASFPKQFPFSAMVPKVYSEVREFILSCVRFSEDLNLSHEEIDETVRKATNILLTRTLSGCLSSLIRKDSLSLLQLIQIDINTYHLENTNVHLEKYISEITGKLVMGIEDQLKKVKIPGPSALALSTLFVKPVLN